MIYKPSAWTYVLAGILAGWAGAEIIHKEKSAQTCENFDETVEKNGSLIGRNGDLEYLLDKNNCPISRGFARINPTSYSLTAELEPCVYVLAPDGAIEEAHDLNINDDGRCWELPQPFQADTRWERE